MFCEHTNIICTVWNSGDKAPLLRQCQQQNNPRFCLNSFPFLSIFVTLDMEIAMTTKVTVGLPPPVWTSLNQHPSSYCLLLCLCIQYSSLYVFNLNYTSSLYLHNVSILSIPSPLECPTWGRSLAPGRTRTVGPRRAWPGGRYRSPSSTATSPPD